MTTTTIAPRLPKRFTKPRRVEFWGGKYNVTPAVAEAHLGDGRTLLRFTPLNTRPDYYLVRVDSSWGKGEDWDDHEHINDVIELLEEEFSEKEREREYLSDDLREQGIEPTAENTDLDGNEDRLGWPVLSLDSGYCWGVEAVFEKGYWR
jgi:hypothetical protein